MTERMTDHGSGEPRQADERAADAILGRALQRARWSLFWERLWPALVSLATAFGLFLALSWLGLWTALPPLGRAAGLFVFFVLAVAATVPLFLVRAPSREDGLARLDRVSGRPHRPATAIADHIAVTRSDPFSLALWRAHVARALAAARALKAGWPSPRVAARDPMALRALVAVLVVVSFFAAGSDRMRRIATAFDWQGAASAANFRVDAWISPPPYTGRPPVILPGLRGGQPVQQVGSAISVPVGSTLVVRAAGDVKLDLTATGGLAEVTEDAAAKGDANIVAVKNAVGTEERRFTVNDSGQVNVRGVGGHATWMFTAIPDRKPTVELTKPPEEQARGAVQLTYKLEDDYGVVGAQAVFTEKPPVAGKPDAAGGKGAALAPRRLYEPPNFPLTLPSARTKQGVGQTLKNLTDHPWAGAEVIMTLTARDEAGNEGASEPYEMRLPQRPFSKPMARALIEQRRVLALDAEMKPQVQIALDALAIAPERYKIDSGVYLGLRSVFWQLSLAESDDQLREVVERLWSMAVTIEDGNLSDVERALRDAQEALRRALERGASDEEIKRLTDQLRAALDQFMRALAEQMRRNPQQLARPLDPNTRMLRPQDLKSMLDRLENLARSGNREAARQLLDQLQQMLENLQTAQPGMQQGGNDMMSALDQLGDMIRRQQQLRDRTFREGQDQRNQQGQQGQQGQERFGDLQRNQQALRDQLNRLMDELRKRGLGQQGQQGQGQNDALGRAGRAMSEAEGSLGKGDSGNAVDAQGRALEALRNGAQSLAQSMQRQPGQNGQGPGQPGRFGPARADQNTDPLGRPLRGRDYGDDLTVKVPGEIDAQRARRILEELRRRFADPQRPQLELEYIERLLKNF